MPAGVICLDPATVVVRGLVGGERGEGRQPESVTEGSSSQGVGSAPLGAKGHAAKEHGMAPRETLSKLFPLRRKAQLRALPQYP